MLPERRARGPRGRAYVNPECAARIGFCARSDPGVAPDSGARGTHRVLRSNPDVAPCLVSARDASRIARAQIRSLNREGLLQLSVDQMQRSVRLRGKLGIMRHDHQSGADGAIELEHQVEHRAGVVPVEIARRLVGKHASRRGN